MVGIESDIFRKRNVFVLADKVVVLPIDPNLIHDIFHGRQEGSLKFFGSLRLEVIGGRRVISIEDFARVVKAHLADRVPKNILGERHGLLCGAIHTDDELVDLRAIAHQPQRLLHRLQ